MAREPKEIINEGKGPGNYNGNEKLGPMKHKITGQVRTLERSPEEMYEIRSRGGIQKGINCAKRRSMREWAKALGAEEVKNKMGETLSRDAVVILQQYQKAMKGDTKSAEFLAKLLGELNAVELPKFD